LTTRLRLILLALVVSMSICLACGLGPESLHAAPVRDQSHAAAATSSARHSFGFRAVSYARRLIGVPYRYGGSTPRSGFDCSGFVSFVYRHLGITLPRSSYGQFGVGRRVARRLLRPGDLVFFDGLGHVGMYVGRGRFIHSPRSGTRVRIERMVGWYGARFVGARRPVRH
jgi:cell wall-associated NlpC family hydrolase